MIKIVKDFFCEPTKKIKSLRSYTVVINKFKEDGFNPEKSISFLANKCKS